MLRKHNPAVVSLMLLGLCLIGVASGILLAMDNQWKVLGFGLLGYGLFNLLARLSGDICTMMAKGIAESVQRGSGPRGIGLFMLMVVTTWSLFFVWAGVVLEKTVEANGDVGLSPLLVFGLFVAIIPSLALYSESIVMLLHSKTPHTVVRCATHKLIFWCVTGSTLACLYLAESASVSAVIASGFSVSIVLLFALPGGIRAQRKDESGHR